MANRVRHQVTCLNPDCGHTRVILRACPKCRPKKSQQRKKTKKTELFKECENMWREASLLRACNRSEFSGRPGTSKDPLQTHHIRGKKNYWLRFSLENSFVLLKSEHIYGVHRAGEEEKYLTAFKRLRGQDSLDKIDLLKKRSRADLWFIHRALKYTLERWRKG